MGQVVQRSRKARPDQRLRSSVPNGEAAELRYPAAPDAEAETLVQAITDQIMAAAKSI